MPGKWRLEGGAWTKVSEGYCSSLPTEPTRVSREQPAEKLLSIVCNGDKTDSGQPWYHITRSRWAESQDLAVYFKVDSAGMCIMDWSCIESDSENFKVSVMDEWTVEGNLRGLAPRKNEKWLVDCSRSVVQIRLAQQYEGEYPALAGARKETLEKSGVELKSEAGLALLRGAMKYCDETSSGSAKVVGEMGKVVAVEKTYGFIKHSTTDTAEDRGDIFFHNSVVVDGYKLKVGDKVMFERAFDKKKKKPYCTWVSIVRSGETLGLDADILKTLHEKSSFTWESFDTLSEGFHRYANRFGYLKIDEDGIQKLSEFLNLNEEQVKTELCNIDLDGNGHISFAEFALWADQHTVGKNLGLDVVDKREWRKSLPQSWNDASAQVVDVHVAEKDLKVAHSLLDAAKENKWDEMFSILREHPNLVDAQPKPRRYAAIHHIVERANLTTLKRFVHSFTPNCSLKTTDGLSPVTVAERSRCGDREEIIQYLLGSGPKDGASEEKQIEEMASEATLSARNKDWAVVYSILSKKPGLVDVLPETRSFSAFHQAAYWGDLKVLKTLIKKYNADPFRLSRDGLTACQIARKRGHMEAAEYLGALHPALILEDRFVEYPTQRFVQVTDPKILKSLESIINNSRKLDKNWTRDRGESFKNQYPVPSEFQLIGAVRNENIPLWRMYTVHREVVRSQCQAEIDGVAPFERWAPWTQESPLGSNDLESLEVCTEANEWLLFHGSRPEALSSISKNGFSMAKVGQGATSDWGGVPPLYGYGAYFTDSITKADEYARGKVSGSGDFPAAFDGCRTVGLVRVMGGRILYCEDDSLPRETLHEKILAGPHHATVGDRLKLRGTYHEYVAYDSSSMYFEYILFYHRSYSASEAPHVLSENL